MIEIRDLCKRYGKFMALDHFNLSIERGELFGFVGSNGAGKTTMLRILSGLLPADSGEIMVSGIDAIRDNEHLKERIGYVPDFFGVYDNLRVTEYMEFYASVYGINGERAEALCMELLNMVNLENKADVMVDTLSRGMKQRLCLARSLVNDPEILILDEPVSGLDPRARIEIKKLLRTFHDMGKTIIISSHILSELAELCTTIGIIEQGRMVLKGSMEEITYQVNAANPVVITVAGERERALEILKNISAVTSISLDENKIIIGFTGEQDKQVELLQQLVSKQVPVISFHRRTGDLESVFMRVTKEKKGEPVI